MVLYKDEEILWTIVLEYIKSYVGKSGLSESRIVDGCIEKYMRKYPEDCCYYLFSWDAALGFNVHWEHCQRDLSLEIERTLLRLAKHLPWVERRGSSNTKYYVTLDRKPKVIDEAKLVNEPKIDTQHLRNSVLQALKRCFDESFIRCNMIDTTNVFMKLPIVPTRRQDYTAQFSEWRIIYASIRQYITDRELCCDCLFDKSGYWELRGRLKEELPTIVGNFTKELNFIEREGNGDYSIRDYKPPKKTKIHRVDKNLAMAIFWEHLVNSEVSHDRQKLIERWISLYVESKGLGMIHRTIYYTFFEGKEFSDRIEGAFAYRQMEYEFKEIHNEIKRKRARYGFNHQLTEFTT